MAKKTIVLKSADQAIDGTIAGLSFIPALVGSIQVGDVFYVPSKENLVILGNAIEDRDASGVVRTDDDGNPKMRSVGQRILAVRVVDGQPQSVQELYMGQIIKVDYTRKVVFNNDLAKAYRHPKADEMLKNLMCERYLVVKEEGVCEDRIWDTDHYKRDENGKWLHEPKTCYRWEVETVPASVNKEACENMIVDYFNENYANLSSPVSE